MNSSSFFRCVALGFSVFTGAAGLAQSPIPETPGPLRAVAVLHPAEGGKISGIVTFTEVADGVRVDANITGLTPGKHGFHVHEFGDCSSADGSAAAASAAGDHFNPAKRQHAAPDAAERHEGDMGNIEADASGAAKLNYIDHTLSLHDGEQSIIGRAVIVHAKADDLKSQPSGDAGARVACGVIGRVRGN
ncbi:MAG: superoxide dismutase family protein [Pseudomonadota bacterium]|nr:superoxide dismutase family protein [Pseudomonadota bacterium]